MESYEICICSRWERTISKEQKDEEKQIFAALTFFLFIFNLTEQSAFLVKKVWGDVLCNTNYGLPRQQRPFYMSGSWVLEIYCPLHLPVLNFVDFPNMSEKLSLFLDH